MHQVGTAGHFHRCNGAQCFNHIILTVTDVTVVSINSMLSVDFVVQILFVYLQEHWMRSTGCAISWKGWKLPFLQWRAVLQRFPLKRALQERCKPPLANHRTTNMISKLTKQFCITRLACIPLSFHTQYRNGTWQLQAGTAGAKQSPPWPVTGLQI